jgi:hypothetical protein
MTALVAQLTAPTTPGMYTLRWDLYRDGVGWFADQPAPAGRSQPLDLTVEVVSTLALDVQLSPVDVAAGASLMVNISLEGPMGYAFEARTYLPQGVSYVAGSGQSAPGNLYFQPAEVSWVGAFDATPAQASFALNVSAGLREPLALSTMTTLEVGGYAPLALERRFIVNGYHSYLPLASRR